MSWQNVIWEGIWGPGSVSWKQLVHCVGEAMGHEQRQVAALLRLLYLLWLLPHSWTALQGMTAPPFYFHSEEQEPGEPTTACEEPCALQAGGKYCGREETSRIGERSYYGWTANDVRGAFTFPSRTP